MLTRGECSTSAALARRLGFSRVWVTQVLSLLKLTPEILEVMTDLGDPLSSPMVTERMLRSLTHLTAEEQYHRIKTILSNLC
jgi:hypothetical protein